MEVGKRGQGRERGYVTIYIIIGGALFCFMFVIDISKKNVSSIVPKGYELSL